MKILLNIDLYKKIDFGFDINKVSDKVLKETLNFEKIKYDVSLNITLVNSAKIKKLNMKERNINKITDVLSFPNIPFSKPSRFKEFISKSDIDVSIIDLTTNTIFLGDVVINEDYIMKKAKEYGHSPKREYAFLLTHSILHLLGYDHIDKKSEHIMFKKQEKILNNISIRR